MKIIIKDLSRKDVISFYVEYDRRKKPAEKDINLTTWLWDDPVELDNVLKANKFKSGVLPAYMLWNLVELDFNDILDCAIVNHIFPDLPQALNLIQDKGVIEIWRPPNLPNSSEPPEWWVPLSSGSNLPREWALILRPSTLTEKPAKWYVEDGSGRVLALAQHVLKYGDKTKTAYAYLGVIPDENSPFIKSRPELSRIQELRD